MQKLQTMKRGKVNITTLGCSKNLVDSEMLLNQLDLNGFEVVHDSLDNDSNIVILNTCGFIMDAKDESISSILNYVEDRKEGKLDKLLVMGCLSARYKEDLQKEIPEVDKFYGKFDYKEIINDLNADFFESKMYHRWKTTPKHFSHLKISEGCNRHCSFCAIPQFTGIHKSRSIESLLAEAKELVAGGVKELLIIAQDLSYYGIDMYGESKLAELVDKLADIEGLEWIRLHYAYPSKFPMDLLKVIRERDNVANYLDLPLQHITDSMLGKMRRKITKEETIRLVETIRKEVPGIALRTTFLVGHPGETDEDFEELKAFVSEYKFDRLGVFPYSDEDDTYAFKMYEDDVPQETKHERAADLMDLQQGISEERNRSFIGKTVKVLVDREEKEFFVGRTEFDSPEVDGEVLIKKSDDIQIGNYYQIEINDCNEFDLIGELA